MTRAVVDKLRALVGASHVVEGIELARYVVEGRTPLAAVFPGSIDEAAACVAAAADGGVAVIPWGGGTAVDAGAPPAAVGIVLALSRLSGLVEHEPGDLTATVGAGMTVGALQTALRERGQWLSLDPPDADRATLGGVVAANAFGPRRHLYGTMRDLLIGVTVVTADGAVVRGGGKVVKNVAGYDLPKLFVGSYGTLGVIVEVTVKLRPCPEDERLLAVRFERLKDAGVARQRGLTSAWSSHAGVGLVTGAVAAEGEVPPAAHVAAALADWRASARAGGGHGAVIDAPLAVKSLLPVWDDAGAAGRVMQRIKAQLDPRNVLNPGRFVAGI